MHILFWIVIAIVAYWLIRKSIRRMRFGQIQNEYEAKWELLSPTEKIELLYAFVGFTYKKKSEEAEEASTEKVEPTIHIAQDLYANDLFSDAVKIRASCPKYEEMGKFDLLSEFWERINFHWKIMEMLGDYNFTGTRVELEYVFSNRKQLADMVQLSK